MTEPAERPAHIRFSYLKSNSFRVIHVDGALGGPTPSGYIHMTLYSERAAIPQQTEYEITAEGTLGKEVTDLRVGRDGIVRELEVDAIMNVATARALHEWLGTRLEQLTARGDV